MELEMLNWLFERNDNLYIVSLMLITIGVVDNRYFNYFGGYVLIFGGCILIIAMCIDIIKIYGI